LQKFLRRLTRATMAESLADQSDRQLVERFLAERNEAAFEAIVRRHGPMVYRVCFRILQQSRKPVLNRIIVDDSAAPFLFASTN
jgi:hypothetical protein